MAEPVPVETVVRQSPEFAAKLTDWVNEPTLANLKLDLENSREDQQKKIQKITRWNNLLHVENEAKPKKVKGRSSVQPKLIRRQNEWRYSALTEPFLGTNSLFKVDPVTFEDTNAAKQNAKVLNYQFRTKINRIKFIDDFVRATTDEGTCILQVGWCRYTVPMKEMVPVFEHYEIVNEEELAVLQQALELKEADPRSFSEKVPVEIQEAVKYFEETGTATTAKIIREEETTVEKVLKNHPTVVVRNPKNVYIDPTCEGDLDKAMFVALSFETSKAELLKEKTRYKNIDLVDWESATPLTEVDHETNIPQTFNMTGARKKVVAYEYWGFYDIHNDGSLVPIVATWIGNTLIRMELNPFPDQKLPFIVVPYLPVKRELYGEPDAELLEENQKIIGAVTRGMIDLLGRSANGQQGFAKGMLDPLNRRRYEEGKDYEFNPNLSPAQGLIEHKYPELPGSALQMLGIQNQEAEALTGVKSFSGGLSGESYGEVAAGIKGLLDAAAKREMAILRRMAKGITELGEKFASMNAVFLSEEETIRITNEQFETIKREDLAGNFDFTVDISTAEVDNLKAQDLAFMLQTMGPNMDLGMTIMILSEIADLKRMPELAERIRRYQPQPDPLEQEKMKLEIEELRLKVRKLQSEVELNEAKAAEARAKADQAALDFVEQEGGTKHARDLEKQQAQADGNKELEITKALVKGKKENEGKPDIEAAIGWNELSKNKGEFGVIPDTLPVDNGLNPAEIGFVDPSLVP